MLIDVEGVAVIEVEDKFETLQSRGFDFSVVNDDAGCNRSWSQTYTCVDTDAIVEFEEEEVDVPSEFYSALADWKSGALIDLDEAISDSPAS